MFPGPAIFELKIRATEGILKAANDEIREFLFLAQGVRRDSPEATKKEEVWGKIRNSVFQFIQEYNNALHLARQEGATW